LTLSLLESTMNWKLLGLHPVFWNSLAFGGKSWMKMNQNFRDFQDAPW